MEAPGNLRNEIQQTRQPRPGFMRDGRRYAYALLLATGVTALVPVATRRRHLPLTIPEPAALYAKRMASRAFMYATCINIYLGIGITAAACYSCEIDNMYDISWMLGQSFRRSGLGQSGISTTIREVRCPQFGAMHECFIQVLTVL